MPTVSRLLAIAASFALIACVSDRSVQVGTTGSAGNSQGGRDAQGGRGGSSGGKSAVEQGGAAGADCLEGQRRCAGNTPEYCEEGAWLTETECSGSKSICQNGVCSSLRSSGHLSWQAAALSPKGSAYRLVRQRLSVVPAWRGQVNGKWLNVTGTLHP